MKYKKLIVALLLILTIGQLVAQFTQITYPGIVSNKADSEGYYAAFGNGSSSLLVGSKKIFIGINVIQSKVENSALFPTPLSPLYINPDGGGLNIGPSFSETSMALGLHSTQDMGDLRLGGHGWMSTQGSFIVQLDDDNDYSEFFGIKESEFGDLFWIGENGSHFLKGDLIIDGTITHEVVDTQYEVVTFLDWEVVDNHGDELWVSFGGVRGDEGNIGGQLENPSIISRVQFPSGAVVHEVSFSYSDSDDGVKMSITLFGIGPVNAGGSRSTNILDGSEPFNSLFPQFVTIPLNDVTSGVVVRATSKEWDGQSIGAIKFKYTMP